ncbi:MAG: hypothetical protein KDA86_05775 [Planctomycetaceae bacterium]|nr:hypothetical protein [Planctomycetaceae bacterium]
MSPPNTPTSWRWFHVILGTYGSWLPGDPRGFRTRHHRDHVDGDYKNPPPTGLYDGLNGASHSSLKSSPVVLTWDQRVIVGNALRCRLEELKSTVACLAISRQHAHLLAKLPPQQVRDTVGNAKKTAWFKMREAGFPQKLWAKRAKCDPMNDRRHQLNVYHYILRHEREGAYVWRYVDVYGDRA